MRDRLARLLSEAEGLVNNDLPTVEQIADYLIEHGVIVPPCKVGDTVYVVSRYFAGTWEIFEGKIDEITLYEKHTFIRIKAKGNFIFAENISEIGKCVFFTREEAEKALAERSRE